MKARSLVMILTALLFNVVIAGTVSAATGFNPLAVLGGGSLLSYGIGQLNGIAPMALQKEIWIGSLVENLFADNSFMSKAFNADEFVNNRTVHIPNAGAPSGVVKNRTQLPATIKAREDFDLTFDLEEFTTDPIRISNADQVELSYNKRESLLMNDKASLYEVIANDFVYKWSTADSTRIVRTTGADAAAHVPAATGNRKAIKSADVLGLMNKFNAEEVPQENRYLMLDAVMYGQLLADLTTAQTADFNKQADIAKGVLGQLFTFNIMMRSKAGRYTTALSPKEWTAAGATTDNAAGIAWHIGSVCRAMGQTEMFEELKSPTYYGDLYSFLVRAGGRIMRKDVKGIAAIVQA